ISNQLDSVERNIQDYKSSNSIYGIDAIGDLYLSKVKELDTRNEALNMQLQVLDEVRNHFQERACQTVINRNVRLAEAPSHGKPVLLYDAVSQGARNYLELANEILMRNGLLAAA
ncbi:MAG: ParA family protein, partial [Candidatus Kapaibacterium sp.]